MSRPVLILLCCAAAVAAQQLNCTGSTPSFDAWCQASCNHSPAVCPPSLCTCDGSRVVTNCTVVGPLAGLINPSVCDDMCGHNPASCPPQLCDCTNVPSDPIVRHEPGCCAGDPRILFYAAGPTVYRYSPGGTPEVCYEFPGGSPTDIAIDDNDNMYIADPSLASVFRASVNCDPDSLVTLTNFHSGPIGNPTGLEIAEGGLYITSHTRVYFMTFTDTGDVAHIITTGITVQYASAMSVGTDGHLYFILREASIYRYDPVSGSVTLVLAVHQHGIPDMRGLVINDCGLFLTATDSNHVWFCSDPQDGSSCELYCVADPNIDARSCHHLRDPTGITSGCCCDIYVTNPGNGNIVFYQNDGLQNGPFVGEVELSDVFFPSAITFYSPRSVPGCSGCPSPLPSPSTSSSPSITPSPSASPSPTSVIQTARLVPGINIQASGGISQSGVLTGQVSVDLIKCDPGVPADFINCVSRPDNTFKIPVSMLQVVTFPDVLPQQSSPISPFLTAVSEASGGSAPPVCMWHTEPLIRRGSVIEECDLVDCIIPGEGQVNTPDCTTLRVEAADAEARARAGMSAAAGGVDTSGVNINFQSATNELCDGEVVAEFSLSLFAGTAGDIFKVSAITQPRLDVIDRCNPSLARGARVCYDTSQGQALHGLIGSDNLVCMADSIFVLPNGQSDTAYVEFDDNLSILAGDIIDINFGVSARSTGCPFSNNPDPALAALCGVPNSRLCHQSEC